MLSSRVYLHFSCVPAHSCNLRLVDHGKYNLNPNNDHHRREHFDLVSSTFIQHIGKILIPRVGLAMCKDTNPNHTSGSYKCADVYCINLDTYSKLDVPTTPVKVSVDLDVLQILEVDDVKFTVAFSMYFGVRCVMGLHDVFSCKSLSVYPGGWSPV